MAIADALDHSRVALKRFADTSEATAAEVREARESHAEAEEAVVTARLLFDFAVAVRLGEAQLPTIASDVAAFLRAAEKSRAADVAARFRALHFPVAFPEVFLRERGGFDCILGNPPWEKVMFEPQQFWVTRFPGLNALSDENRTREIEHLRLAHPDDAAEELRQRSDRDELQSLIAVSYSKLGVGHYDYAKLFVERFGTVVSESGRIGVVLPRSALVLGGWGKLRHMLIEHRQVTTAQARNKAGWLFDDVDQRYTVVLLTRGSRVSVADAGVSIWPDVASPEQVKMLDRAEGLRLDQGEVETLSDSWVVPWFNTKVDVPVFDKMRQRPRLSGGEGWITGRHDARWDFRARGGQRDLAAGRREGPLSWRVLMTRHLSQFRVARADALYQKFVLDPRTLAGPTRGVTVEGNVASLGPDHPAIIVRHPSRNDDSRTLIAGALANRGEVHAKGYVHSIAHASGTSHTSILALLGYINTYTCDWWARRFVDRHVTAPVINNLPLPDWSPEDQREASLLASEMLVRRGTPEVAGGISISLNPAYETWTEEALFVRIEQLAQRGFDLTDEEMAVVFSDFTETAAACPTSFRSAFRAASGART